MVKKIICENGFTFFVKENKSIVLLVQDIFKHSKINFVNYTDNFKGFFIWNPIIDFFFVIFFPFIDDKMSISKETYRRKFMKAWKENEEVVVFFLSFSFV